MLDLYLLQRVADISLDVLIRERRWQDLLVIGGVLPLGVALLLLGAIELRAGGY